MFPICSRLGAMQQMFDFGARGEIAGVRDRLAAFFGTLPAVPERTPIAQLVKSLISNRTYDEVSLRAYQQLTAAYSDWAEIVAAADKDIERLIADVQFADRKAGRLVAALRIIGEQRADFDLGFLAKLPMEDALAWLERLPGVGRKVAASVLNFSTLRRPALVIDTHVERVLKRLGLVGPRAEIGAMYDAAMSATVDWSATELTDLHVWMKRLGQTLCRPLGSRCHECPLRGTCIRSTSCVSS